MTAVEVESDWSITARAFSFPLLCHNAHFIRKQKSVLLAILKRFNFFENFNVNSENGIKFEFL